MVDDRQERQDRLRTQIAWIVTAVWVLCFPAAAALDNFPYISWAQPPMMLVAGWLFVAPLTKRDTSGGDK